MPQKKHILFVIVGVSAGTGTFTKSLGAGLRKFYGEEFKVSLLTFRPDASLPENAANFDETFVLARNVHDDWRRAIELPASVVKLRAAVKRIQPDLVFTIGTFANVVAGLSVTQCPVVLSEHLNMTHRLRGTRFGKATQLCMRRAYPERLMIVASQELADDLKANFNVTRVAVIPNGIDASVIRKRAAETPAMELPKPYFVSVGRLSEQKDIATALRAFAAARQSGLQSNYLIVGDGEQRTMLEVLAAELKLGDAVRFAGHQPNPYPLIAGAEALVLSSIWEGFAYVPIEAMALGVPVISTNCPSGPAEILSNGRDGILVPPSDSAALAQAMLKMAEPPTRAHFATAAQSRAEELSIETMSRAYRDLFAQEMSSTEKDKRQPQIKRIKTD